MARHLALLVLCCLAALAAAAAADVDNAGATRQQRQEGGTFAVPVPAPVPFNPFRPFSRPSLLQVPGRPGLCPFVSRLVPSKHSHSSSVCGNLCYDDRACPLGQKCCPTECGYSCFRAVNVSP